mgnify:CR=1 FL=1|jgi:guanylate kinase|tara:strand:+ start:140 stop:703 length:564 start_codon:yes stop_codon:yes gene_type:complete
MIVKGGFLIIVAGPSGSGKSSITKLLLEYFKNLDFSISCTTRKMRQGEIEGEHYKFITQDEFNLMIEENKFLEYENVHNELYGTPIEPISDSVKFGHSILLDIDVKGAYSIMNTNHFDCCSIFIKTPSIEVLHERLVARNDLTDDQIEKRVAEAKNELKKSTYFDHLIINDDLSEAFNEAKRIISGL